MIALLGRLFFWQVIKGKSLAAQAQAQHLEGQNITANRGNILADDESWLAASYETWVVYASGPELTQSAREIANKLAPFLADDEEDKESETELQVAMRVEGLLEDRESYWIPLKRRVPTEIKKNIEALGIEGIRFERHEARIYPEGSSSAHLLGFVGKDNEGVDTGYFGLEGYYDLVLAGRSGFRERESNPLGVPILIGSNKQVDAQYGVNLVTNIDKGIQMLVEEKLKKGLETYGALDGTVIVMNPRTGAIMAMASFPNYDPETYYDFKSEDYTNPAISKAFEPGSVFKPIVMAAGLDAGVVEPDTKCDICGEPLKVDKYFIKTWNNEYHKDTTMTEVIVHSDNVGMAYVGQKLGADKLYDYLDNFGFGRLTNIDLQGEANPKMRDRGTWNIVDTATATFGQGIAITPIQMIKAISIIANDGVEVTPQIVDKLKLEGWEQDIEPVYGRRVISQKAADEITQMMVQAASDGEAKWAAIKGFDIAGKTGTAQIPVQGHYDEEKTIASFVGFAPSHDPKFAMLVTMREPQTSQWASETAAPLWFGIANDLFPYLGIHPDD